MKKFAKRVLPMILIMALLAAMMTVPVAAGQDKTYLFNKTGNDLSFEGQNITLVIHGVDYQIGLYDKEPTQLPWIEEFYDHLESSVLAPYLLPQNG